MALDEADKAAIAEMFKTGIGEALVAGLKPVLERIGGLEAKKAPDVDALVKAALEVEAARVKAEAEKGKPNTDPKVDPKIAEQIAQLTAKLEDASAKTTAAEKARAESVMLSHLRDALGKAGIPANRIPQAVGWLHDTAKRIELNDAGVPVMVFDRTGAGGAYKDRPALADGVAEWLKSDEGKSYLPPVKVQGLDPVRQGPRFGGGGKDAPIDMAGLRRVVTGKLLEMRAGGRSHVTTLEDVA